MEQAHGALPGLDEANARYFMAIRTGVTISILNAWLDGGRKETVEELLTVIEHQFEILQMGFSGQNQPAMQ